MAVHDDISISALILAGGRATRMGGIAKHEIIVQGETILARQSAVLRGAVGSIIVSSPVPIEGFTTVRDAPEHEGIGPLAGIAAGLATASTHWMLIVAGDMPYLSPALIGHMVELASLAGGHSEEAHAPTWRGAHAIALQKKQLPEPLLSVVRVPRAREVVASLIAARDYKASRMLDGLNATYVADELARSLDPDLLTLHNINEPSDIL